MTRRILQVIATLDRAGAEKQLVLLSRNLPRDQFDVHVCALTRGGPLAADLQSAGIEVTVLGKAWKFDPMAWWALRRHIARLRPELVHTWMFTANAYGRSAAHSAGVGRVVASERCVDPWKSWLQLAIDRRLARRTDAIVVNSRGVEEFYAGQGIPSEKMRLIANGVEPAPASPVTREAFMSELRLPAHAWVIGAVGRLWPQKRIKDLIWATDLLKVAGHCAHLLLVGDGPQRRTLERFARSCHVENEVHFLGARNDVPRLMPHFDMLWLASGYEGMPNSVMEAMACGVPVVATDIWGNRELVLHGQTGFLVSVGDRAGLARCAHKMIEDRQLGPRLGAAGRERILREFSVEKMVAAHAALYRELLNA